MPATEQTWRDSKLLHVIFGVSGVAMLVMTIWMLAADHNREWKPVQRKFREIEAWYTQAKITEQDSTEYEQEKAELEKAVAKAEAEPPSESIVSEFVAEARKFAEANGYDVAKIDTANEELRSVEKAADPEKDQQRLIAARANLIETMNGLVRKAQFDEDKRFSLLKFRRADLDVARSTYNLGVGEGLP